jgi:molecular chaperone DnaK (HSP70)
MVDVDPMTAVAEGAALAASILTNQTDEFDFFLGTEHALGTVVHDEANRGTFAEIIPRNTKLPAAATKPFQPRTDDQPTVMLRVIEGDPDQPIEHEDNVILKEWDVELLEPRKVDQAGFEVTFAYDVDGILHVKVVDGLTQTVMMDDELAFGAARSKKDLVDMRRRLDATSADDAAPPPVAAAATNGLSEHDRGLLQRLTEKVRPFVDDAEQANIDAAVDALLSASGGPDTDDRRQQVERLIRTHAYLL